MREIVPSITHSREDKDALSSVDQVFYDLVDDVAFDDSDSGAEKLFAYYSKSEDFCSKIVTRSTKHGLKISKLD